MRDLSEKGIEKTEIEKLLHIKERLERKITECKAELEYLHYLLEFIEKQLAERSFKVAAEKVYPKPAEASKPLPTAKQAIPLRATDGNLLATIYVENNEMRVIPSEKIRFNVNIPPFQQFLVEKVLNGMSSKDREEAMAGKIAPDEILTYRILKEGDILKEVMIRNWREERRITTLKNSIRWTLEKMYEKMKL